MRRYWSEAVILFCAKHSIHYCHCTTVATLLLLKLGLILQPVWDSVSPGQLKKLSELPKIPQHRNLTLAQKLEVGKKDLFRLK